MAVVKVPYQVVGDVGADPGVGVGGLAGDDGGVDGGGVSDIANCSPGSVCISSSVSEMVEKIVDVENVGLGGLEVILLAWAGGYVEAGVFNNGKRSGRGRRDVRRFILRGCWQITSVSFTNPSL